MATERKKLLLRLDPAVHDALVRWAGDEMRSTNAEIEFLLRRALREAGRLPGNVARMRAPGRPRADPDLHQLDPHQLDPHQLDPHQLDPHQPDEQQEEDQ